MSGHTSARTAQRPNGDKHLQTGSTPTTITGATPQSAATHHQRQQPPKASQLAVGFGSGVGRIARRKSRPESSAPRPSAVADRDRSDHCAGYADQMSALSTLDQPLYSASLAAEYLQVPKRTLGYWLEGVARDGVVYEPVVRPAPTGTTDLTWGEFVECWYVRQYRRVHEVPMRDIRRLITGLREELGVAYPLAHKKAFVAAGRRLAFKIQQEDELSPRSWMVVTAPDGQLGLSTIAESFLEEVDFSSEGDRIAVRISPDGHHSAVTIQPDIAFGAPHVAGIRTENLAELVEAGEDLESVAADFGLSESDLRAALAYEWRRSRVAAA